MGVFLFILKEPKELMCRSGDRRGVWHLTGLLKAGVENTLVTLKELEVGRVYGLEKMN